MISLLTGCAITSVFVSYPSSLQVIKQHINNSQFKTAQDILDNHRNDNDHILYMMERARVSQIGGDIFTSIEDFKQVISAFKTNEEKAIISASDSGNQAISLFTNDNAIPYVGDAYERIFVYQFQALNYLFNNEIEKALVEVRRANDEQQFSLELHQKEIAAAQSDNKSNNSADDNFRKSFASLDNAANRVKNSFQNAYTFYASGIIYEATGQHNDAYIDYKKAINIFPNNTFLQQDVLRLSKQLGMREDYERYSEIFSTNKSGALATDQGKIVIFYEQGFAPVKLEIKVPILTANRWYTVAFPIYDGKWKNPTPLLLSINNQSDSTTDPAPKTKLGQTLPIVQVGSLAAKALLEKLPSTLVRQTLRIIAKKQTADASGKVFGDLGRFTADIFNLISENADRRSWLTLPDNAQIYRGSVSYGRHKLFLTSDHLSDSINIEVRPGKMTIIRVINTGTKLNTQFIVL